METKRKHTDLTRYMLHYCYTCDEAGECDTERKCAACMEKRNREEDKRDAVTTKDLLTLYAL
ncbi:hypothetical protein [Paenibacillus xanthanilyticus]|uniref:Uncharacterized protein n=1 Tax=Paenibacillus xanthanilyticus TaxID=1783531 RepID=A0ABV8JZY7_9BACL